MQESNQTAIARRRRLFRGESLPSHDTFYGTDSCGGCNATLRALAEQCGGAATVRNWRKKAPVERRSFRQHKAALIRHHIVKKGGDRKFRPAGHFNDMRYWGIKFLIEDLMQLHPEVAHYGGNGVNMFGGHFPVTEPWVDELRTALRSAVGREVAEHQERAAARITPLTPKQRWEREVNRLDSLPRVIVLDVDLLLSNPSKIPDSETANVDPWAEWVRHQEPDPSLPPILEDLAEARKRAFRTVKVRGARNIAAGGPLGESGSTPSPNAPPI